MADAIVQTIKVQVEGTEEAAAEFKKLGDAGAQSAEQLQSAVAPAAQGAGKGLDQVAEKASISGGQLKALGKVAKTIGGEGGELAGVAIAFTRMAKSMGAIGVAVFAAAEAFSFIKGEMKKAEEAAKAVTASFANIAKVSAEMKVEDEAKFWGTTAEAMKKFANDAGRVADQLRNIAAGAKEAISPLTSEETLGKAFVKVLEGRGIAVNDVLADTKKLTEASRQAALEAAKIFEKMSPIEKLNFEKVLKGLGFTDEQIKNIEKGSKAMEKFLQTPGLSKEKADVLKAFGDAWDKSLEQAQGAIQALTIGFGKAVLGWKKIFSGQVDFGAVLAEAGNKLLGGLQQLGSAIAPIVQGWVTTAAANAWQWISETASAVWENVKIAARAAYDAVVAFVTTAPGKAWAWIKDTAASVWEQVKAAAQQVYDGVAAFVTTAPANAWQWVVDTATSAWNSVKQLGQQAYDAVVAFVTTAPGNAWQWIVDTFQAVIDKIKGAFGFGGGQAAPAGGGGGGGGYARGGLLGGRGSGTSDSNLAWVSRGEYLLPARAVAQPGVLALLESLRLAGGNLRGLFDGMHFAAGGLIMPRAVPAFGGASRDLGTLTLGLPDGASVTVRASQGVVDELRRAAALGQVRSGGRKPSRYS